MPPLPPYTAGLHQFGQLSVRKENSITFLLLGYNHMVMVIFLLEREQNLLKYSYSHPGFWFKNSEDMENCMKNVDKKLRVKG